MGYELFPGNRTDVTTVEETIEIMEGRYGKANRIWGMDRGMVSEEIFSYISPMPSGKLRDLWRNIDNATFHSHCLRR